MTYNQIVKSVTLTAAAPQASADWTSLLVNGKMAMPVTYTYTVNFKDVDTTQRPGQLTSSALSASGNIDIEPRGEVYDVTIIPVRTFGLPWDRYPSVEVECRYADAANAILQQPSAILTSQNTEVDWALFMRDLSRRTFSYRLTFALAAGGTRTTEWINTSDTSIDIADPYPTKIGLTILAALDWSVFAQALVFVAYPSKEKPAIQQTYTLTPVAPSAPTFVVDRQDAAETFIYYEARLIKKSGQVWTVPGSVISEAYLILQDGMKGHQVVVVRPENIDFGSKHVLEIDVQVRYVDPGNGINATQSFVLKSSSDGQTFAYDYLNPSISAQYRADIQLDNGQTKSIDWTAATANAVTIALSQLD